jgi:hypothetical protein
MSGGKLGSRSLLTSFGPFAGVVILNPTAHCEKENGMANSWGNMTNHEKLETLRQDMDQIYAAVNALRAATETNSSVAKLRKVAEVVRAMNAESTQVLEE